MGKAKVNRLGKMTSSVSIKLFVFFWFIFSIYLFSQNVKTYYLLKMSDISQEFNWNFRILARRPNNIGELNEGLIIYTYMRVRWINDRLGLRSKMWVFFSLIIRLLVWLYIKFSFINVGR